MEYVMIDKILYGKDATERIVNIQVHDDYANLFIRNQDGTLTVKQVPNRHWAISPKASPNSTKLDGDLFYRYGVQFKTEKDKSKFMSENPFAFCIWNSVESLMVKDGYTCFKNLSPKEPVIMGLDIEATGLNLDDTAKVLMVALTTRDTKGILTRRLFAYDEYENDKEMFDEMSIYIREQDPDFILMHNGYTYDIPYLKYCADRVGASLDWGRDGSALKISTAKKESKFRIDGSRDLHYKKAFVYGRDFIDTMFLAYRYDTATKKYQSYGLKKIIQQEGLEEKDRVHYDANLIRVNYKIPEEWAKIKAYCLGDADDLIKLYDLMVPPFFYMANFIPKPFQLIIESASGSQLNAMMIRSYLQDKHSIPKADKMEPYPGAISFGVPGIWNNTFKVDVASLYPSIMLHYKVSNPLKDPKGYLYQLVKTLREKRLYHKKLAKDSPYHEHMQNSLKILINSLYGFLGTPGLNFNYLAGADFITRTGKEILKNAILWASGEMYVERPESDSAEEDT